jgi:hypothetical protein
VVDRPGEQWRDDDSLQSQIVGIDFHHLFANNLISSFVTPQPEEYRLTKLVILRPLGKLDLGDQHGFNPVAPFHDRWGYS